MKSARKRSHQTDSNQILVSIISHKQNGLRNNDTIDDTKKVILYSTVASDSKKERYMLELLPDKNKLAVQTKESLRKIQDILGSIHDSDFTVGYLQSLPQSCKEIQEILDKENDHRYT